MFLRLKASALAALVMMTELNAEQPAGGGGGVVQTSAQPPGNDADSSPTGAPPTAGGDPRVNALESRVSALESALAARSAPPAPPKPSPGRIVVVRDLGKDSAGIVAEVNEDGTIVCNVFRGDHLVHVASHLTQIPADATSRGWFWPPRT